MKRKPLILNDQVAIFPLADGRFLVVAKGITFLAQSREQASALAVQVLERGPA
jgi:hypothetical protein